MARSETPQWQHLGVELRDHHLGPISSVKDDQVNVDVGALVRRLLLFEHCTLESNRLNEFPALISTFGVDGVMSLIDSGAVSIISDAMTAGQVGQLGILKANENRGGPLPLCSYRLATVGLVSAERDKHISDSLQVFKQARGPLKKIIKLKQLLVPMIGTYPPSAGTDGVADAIKEIVTGKPTLWAAIRREGTRRGVAIAEPPEIDVIDLGDDEFRIDTNLPELVGAQEAHSLIERAILGMAGINIRIHLMKHLQGVTGFQDDEFPLFEDKVGFLLRSLDPEVQEDRFDRIVRLGGLPELSGLPEGVKIDVRKLLNLRDSDECKEFRKWLREVDSETDDEIQRRFDSLRGRAAEIVEGRTGHAVRFALTTGAGFIPIAGAVLGPAASAADTFLLEKLIGKPGPTVFLSKNYPSMFG